MGLFTDSKFQTNLAVEASLAEIITLLSVVFNRQHEVLDIQFAIGLWMDEWMDGWMDGWMREFNVTFA